MSTFDVILEFINEKIWLAVFIVLLFARSCPRKSRFAIRSAGGILGVFLLGLLPRILVMQFPASKVLNLWMTGELFIWPVLMALYMGVMFCSNWNMMLFTALAGLCTQETVFGIWAFVSVKIPAVATDMGELLVCAVLGSCFAISLYYFLAVKITPRNLQVLQQRSLIPLLALYLLSALLVYYSSYIVLTMVLFFDVIRGALADAEVLIDMESVRLASIYVGVFGNAMVLFALRNMLRYSDADLEKEMLEQIREQDRKQYIRFRENVDYINTKSHDLKHYLSLLQHNEKLPERELHQVSESIRHLDSETDSGNETLDLILTDRYLACQSKGIELIFQTDGTRLEQLDVIDTYTIFCNILDNAVGYVEELPQAERQIRLGIRTIHGMVFIHQENPLEGTLDMKDGLPVTTQTDPTLHGFGLKSVQSTVKKRGGELAIQAESGRFELDICFPQSTEQK